MERLRETSLTKLRTRFTPLPQEDQPLLPIDNTPVYEMSNRDTLERVQKYISADRKISQDATRVHTRDKHGNLVGVDQEKAVRSGERYTRETLQTARKKAHERRVLGQLFNRIAEELRSARVR